jgi:PAS domain-containing protein
MQDHAWIREFPAAITVCDAEGVILEMNARAIETTAEDGGAALIGRNVLDCHPEPSRTLLTSMLASGQKNVYTIRKNGIRKLIYQSPWYRNGSYAGFVELSLPVPDTMPHFDRDAPKA